MHYCLTVFIDGKILPCLDFPITEASEVLALTCLEKDGLLFSISFETLEVLPIVKRKKKISSINTKHFHFLKIKTPLILLTCF